MPDALVTHILKHDPEPFVCEKGCGDHRTVMGRLLCDEGNAVPRHREVEWLCHEGHAHRSRESWARCADSGRGFTVQRPSAVTLQNETASTCGHFHLSFDGACACARRGGGTVIVALRSQRFGVAFYLREDALALVAQSPSHTNALAEFAAGRPFAQVSWPAPAPADVVREEPRPMKPARARLSRTIARVTARGVA